MLDESLTRILGRRTIPAVDITALTDDLAANLRKPDCDHDHTSFPDQDVKEIISALLRHPEEVLALLEERHVVRFVGEGCHGCGTFRPMFSSGHPLPTKRCTEHRPMIRLYEAVALGVPR